MSEKDHAGYGKAAELASTLVVMGAIVASSVFLWTRLTVKPKQVGGIQELDEKTGKQRKNKEGNDMIMAEQSSSEIEDVWADRLKKGVAPASLNHKRGSGEEKPFASSYYYAHNNPRTKGGYSDGLRMEDFTMNQPRLLSKKSISRGSSSDGKSVENEETREKSQEPYKQQSIKTDDTGPPPPPPPPPPVPRKRILAITKYLWDDPGTGLATIRIDQLPGKLSSDPPVAWRDVEIVNVESQLLQPGTEGSANTHGQGLLVTVLTPDSSDFDYRLNIPRLYGPITEVKAVIKGKRRLLVTLRKKTGLLDKSNAKPWPHPQKKT